MAEAATNNEEFQAQIVEKEKNKEAEEKWQRKENRRREEELAMTLEVKKAENKKLAEEVIELQSKLTVVKAKKAAEEKQKAEAEAERSNRQKRYNAYTQSQSKPKIDVDKTKENQAPNLLEQLLGAGLDMVVTDILLMLDPPSLHAATQVCGHWCDYIKCEVWGRRGLRKRLRADHLDRWLGGEQGRERRWSTGAPPGVAVYSLYCDNYWVMAGLTNGFARVFCISSGQLVAELDCRAEDSTSACCVRGDLGESRLATVTSRGTLAIWRKPGLQLVLKRQLVSEVWGGGLQSVVLVKEAMVLVKEAVVVAAMVVAAPDWVLLLDGQGKELGRLQEYGCGALTAAVSDRRWVAAAHTRAVVVWSLATREWLASIRTGYIATLVLDHPYLFTVGGGGQVAVWNLETGSHLLTLGQDPPLRRLWHLSTNGRFLAGCEFTREDLRSDFLPPLTVTLLDIQDLVRQCKEKPETSSLPWERVIELPTDLDKELPGSEYCCSTLNTTSLVASISSTIFVWDFYQGEQRRRVR